MAEGRILGQRIARVDAGDKVTGRVRYVADLELPGMLHAKAVRSPYPHARIVHLDATPALSQPGVMAVLTAADFTRPAASRLLAREVVLYAGQPVAVVAALTPEQAEEALAAVQVEYEVLPPVVDGLEAMRPDAPLLHPDLYTQSLAGRADRPSNIAATHEVARGDVDAAFAQAAVVIEKTYRTATVHQGYLEPRAALAHVDAAGRVTVYASTQGSFALREGLANVLGLSMSRLRIVPMEVGGGFGAKNQMLVEPFCVLLSQKTGRPVRMVLDRDEDLQAARPAPGTIVHLKMSADSSGQITAAEGSLVFEQGAYPGFAPANAITTGLGAYRIPNLRLQAISVVVNKPPNGSYRAPNAPQAAFAVESHLDQLAQALGMDPIDFRRRNLAEEGERMPNDLPLPKIGLRQVLDRVSEHPAWHRALEGPNTGRGVACGFWMGGGGTSGAALTLNSDGTFALLEGSIDLTGTRTAFVQIVAEEMGVSPEEVSVVVGDTDTAPYSGLSAGSRTARQTGAAVWRACQDAKAELARRAAAALGVAADDVEYAERAFRAKGSPDRAVSLAEMARQSVNSPAGLVIGRGAITGRGGLAPGVAAHIVDVEVDPETGKVRLLNYTAVQDVGRALNPTLIEGQIQGAVAQGVGWALTEGLVFRDGVLANPTFLDYRIPTATDLPYIETDLVEVPADEPYGARGAGEPPIIPPLAALANAIDRAVGVRLTELPMTPEAVWRAIQAREKS